VPLDDVCSRVRGLPGCFSKIRWAKVKPSMHPIPLEPFPEEGGNAIVVSDSPLVVRIKKKNEKVAAGIKTYRTHFETCPILQRDTKPKPPPQMELSLVDEGG
jgi:hypothetical protein